MPTGNPSQIHLCATISQVGVALKMFSRVPFWMDLILVYIITFSLRYLERAVRWLFFPSDDLILAEWEAARDARGPPRKAPDLPGTPQQLNGDNGVELQPRQQQRHEPTGHHDIP
jgi:hypothetical protein